MATGKITCMAVMLFLSAQLIGKGAETGRVQLHGNVPAAVAHLTPKGKLEATNELHLAIGLPLRDPAGLDQFLAEVYDPASPNYRHFLTPEEFTARFSATEEDFAAVKNFALTNGFKITGEPMNRLLLDVSGPVPVVEKAFHIQLNKYQHPTEAREFFAPDTDPEVDAALPVSSISGLDNYYVMRPRSVAKPLNAPANVSPKGGSGSSGSYIGSDFRTAYVPDTTLTGAGQTVGLLQFDGFHANDIAAYASQAGLPNIPVTVVPVDGGVSTPGSGNSEVCLDIEMVMAMAPGVTNIYVFEAPNPSPWVDLLNAMATHLPLSKQLSCSWGGGSPNSSAETIFKQMAAQGQSFFNASGDSDAFTGAIPFPSDSTNITQVGGTTLNTGSGASYASETNWNWGLVQGSYTGSSGGISTYYGIPTWQQGISMTAAHGSTTMRNVPDVALTADNVYVTYNNGSSGIFGGTSCAAPLWAGFMALVNQQAAVTGKGSAGFINPAVYAIGKGQNMNYTYAACFHDTTVGNNYWPSSPTNFPAVAGYDLCTGWGTPNGQTLINALAGAPDSFGISPASGFAAIGPSGGPFSPSSQNFTLTNTGASPFNWSLINTSAWLNASSTSGTLAAGASSVVAVSVTSTANGLALGTYNATLLFSNATTQAAQARSFSVQVVEPLVLLTTNGFTASGPVGGPFNPGGQTIVFTNIVASAVPWSLINTSSWLSVSSSSGTISGNSSVSVTVSTNAAAANLSQGTYNATLVLSNQSSHATRSLAYTVLVGQSLVVNGGFETGDLTGWTQSGNATYTSVSTSSTYVHSGTYGFKSGPNGSLGYISQNLPTYPGQKYLLSLWFSSPDGRTPNQFTVSWNGSILFDQSNIGSIGWTNLQFVVTATSTSTALQFGIQDNPTYLGLDEISVIPVNLPAITQQPASQTVVAGNNAVFNTTVTGSAPLGFQWRVNGVNLANGSGVSGATSNILTLTSVTTNRAAAYTLVVTNLIGSVTSSAANLTVVLPPSIITNIAAQTIECGGNANFTVGVSGTAPLRYQWQWDGTNVAGATNVSLSLTNIHPPGHTVAVLVTNFYGSVTSTAPLNVQDTLPPVITLAGANPYYVELGSSFTDPGATAYDVCAGVVFVSSAGNVDTKFVGTNVITYTATDGSFGVTNTRTVIVRDTTAPTIVWSYTNLVIAAGTNLSVPMPNVTGTNFILATDLSGALTVMQNPVDQSPLPLGTNAVVLTVADDSGNAAFSTNTIVVAPGNDAVLKISGQVIQDVGVKLQLSGGYGSTYVLENTADLLSGAWVPVATNTIGISGVWQFTDSSATNTPSRFYRLKLMP